jgi:anaerobic selenocysteine-containing dehydrogenase
VQRLLQEDAAGRCLESARQIATATICPDYGVGCTLTVYEQDERIVKVTFPIEQEVTDLHTEAGTCIDPNGHPSPYFIPLPCSPPLAESRFPRKRRSSQR